MGVKFLATLLLTIILAITGGVLWFAEEEGMIQVSGPLRDIGGTLPWVGEKISPAARPPATELRELEQLSEEKARDERWAQLKKKEEELRTAENELNGDRSRLSQWEVALEQREGALNEREKTFTDREKQFERSVKFYLTMRPAAAARVLSQQEDLQVIEIFRRMPEQNVSAILSEMDPAVAGAIMRKMAR